MLNFPSPTSPVLINPVLASYEIHPNMAKVVDHVMEFDRPIKSE
jgi:hypothetical protein